MSSHTAAAPAPARILQSGPYKRFQVMAWVTGALLAFMTVVGLFLGIASAVSLGVSLTRRD